jgi:hypothetical protein
VSIKREPIKESIPPLYRIRILILVGTGLKWSAIFAGGITSMKKWQWVGERRFYRDGTGTRCCR